jgi:hypothetical protein
MNLPLKPLPMVLVVLLLLGAMVMHPSPALAQVPPAGGGGPINWGPFTGLFTGAQGAIMIVAAVLCVFLLIAGFITVGVSGGVNGFAIAMFTGCLICVGILAAPALVSFIQNHVVNAGA